MIRPVLVSRPWLVACAVLMVPFARETSGWLMAPAWSSSARRTCLQTTGGNAEHLRGVARSLVGVDSGGNYLPLRRTCRFVALRGSLCREREHMLSGASRCAEIQHGKPPRPPALARRVRARPRALRSTALNANHDNSETAGDDNAAGEAGGAAAAAAAAASAAPQHVNPRGKQERVKAAEDSDAPIFYIKGLKEGGGVGVWGDNGNSGSDDSAGGDVSRARGGGNAAMMARALRNAEREMEGGGNYEEGVEDGGEVEEPVDATPVWEKVQRALGLGVWSYVGLGLAVFIIALNNVLGVGWAAKLIDPDYEPDSVLDLQQQGRQIQYMPLDDASNLLSD